MGRKKPEPQRTQRGQAATVFGDGLSVEFPESTSQRKHSLDLSTPQRVPLSRDSSATVEMTIPLTLALAADGHEQSRLEHEFKLVDLLDGLPNSALRNCLYCNHEREAVFGHVRLLKHRIDIDLQIGDDARDLGDDAGTVPYREPQVPWYGRGSLA